MRCSTKSRLFFLAWAIFSLPLASRAVACASCASGGDDPLILYPNEAQKFYLGVARSTGIRNVGSDGALTSAGGPEARNVTTAAYGYAFSRQDFATVTVPLAQNERRGRSVSGVGDPSVAARHTLVMPALDRPWVPQVQLLGSYRQSVSRSVWDSTDRELLDAFGTGFSEIKGGVDIWFAATRWLAGAAAVAIFPVGRAIDGVHYQPGDGARGTLTGGYLWRGSTRTVAGISREQRGAMRVGGDLTPDGEQINQSLFFSQDYYPSPMSTVRGSLVRTAACGGNKNSARADTFSIAYLRAL